jgi:hypothetical protein
MKRIVLIFTLVVAAVVVSVGRLENQVCPIYANAAGEVEEAPSSPLIEYAKCDCVESGRPAAKGENESDEIYRRAEYCFFRLRGIDSESSYEPDRVGLCATGQFVH